MIQTYVASIPLCCILVPNASVLNSPELSYTLSVLYGSLPCVVNHDDDVNVAGAG